MSEFPGPALGRYLGQVQRIARDVAEERLWQKAEGGDDVALGQVVTLFPNGRYAQEAKLNLDRKIAKLIAAQPKPAVYVPVSF